MKSTFKLNTWVGILPGGHFNFDANKINVLNSPLHLLDCIFFQVGYYLVKTPLNQPQWTSKNESYINKIISSNVFYQWKSSTLGQFLITSHPAWNKCKGRIMPTSVLFSESRDRFLPVFHEERLEFQSPELYCNTFWYLPFLLITLWASEKQKLFFQS